jgi:hypothetical protein
MTSQLTPRAGHVVAVGEIPRCDMCSVHRPAQRVPAVWDCATVYGGSWANLCDPCNALYALQPGTSGVGIGQRLIVLGEDCPA